jgi:hypothetical protein
MLLPGRDEASNDALVAGERSVKGSEPWAVEELAKAFTTETYVAGCLNIWRRVG